MSARSAATMMLLHRRGSPAVLLPEFLKEVYVGGRTGLLHVTRAEGAGVSFRSVNGQVVSGSSTAERGRLGERMVRLGILSRADLERALAIVSRQGRRLAPVLRELELVDTPGLEKALALHIREMLLTALLWDEAALLFEEQELPDAPAEDLTLRCSTPELIFEVVRRIPTPEAVRKGLGSLDRPLVAAEKPPHRLDRTTLGPADLYLLSRANGQASARSVIAAGALPAADLERSLLGLLCTGAVRYGTAAPAKPSGLASLLHRTSRPR
jgi:hypothetical protein